MLDELGRAARTVVDDVSPSLVLLGDRHHPATAIVVSQGRLVANAHSIDEGAVSARTVDGTTLEATIVGIDEDTDVAVLEADGAGPAIHISDEPPQLGNPVFAVGIGNAGPRVTFGLVSSIDVAFRGPRGRRISGLIEHTAHLAPGSSGSALVDAKGRLMGINTSRLGRGFHAALPVNAAFMNRIDDLATGTLVQRPRLGVSIAPPWIARKLRAAVGLAPRDGLLVREVEPDSAAAAAGLVVGDLLLAVDGRPLADPEDLADVIDASPARFEVTLVRGEAELMVPVELQA